MSCARAWPYAIRMSASGANMLGTAAGILFVEAGYKNPFYYLGFYAASTYFVSNAYEAYKALKPSTTPNECELEKGLIDVRTIQK